jgi:branched-chain amino acid transport system substrate-binding protein
MLRTRRQFLLELLSILILPFIVQAEPGTDSLRIGFIGSLSSFAANYGTAALKGAQLAVAELKAKGEKVELLIEDDQSDTKNTVSAYAKLTKVNQVQGIVGGSWWVNAIVKSSERDGIPIISCETLYNGDYIAGKNYFILQGDLRDWIRIYKPLIERLNLKRGAVVHFISGFGNTLAGEFKSLFSEGGRQFAGAFEYTDIQVPNATSLALLIKQAHPDVIYIDGQPGGYATILKRLRDIGLEKVVLLGHSSLADAAHDKLFDVTAYPNLYASRRGTFDAKFSEQYRKRFNEEPTLNADLGYYAVFLLVEALKAKEPIARLSSGIEVAGRHFSFDENHTYTAAPQVISRLTAEGQTAP